MLELFCTFIGLCLDCCLAERNGFCFRFKGNTSHSQATLLSCFRYRYWLEHGLPSAGFPLSDADKSGYTNGLFHSTPKRAKMVRTGHSKSCWSCLALLSGGRRHQRTSHACSNRRHATTTRVGFFVYSSCPARCQCHASQFLSPQVNCTNKTTSR